MKVLAQQVLKKPRYFLIIDKELVSMQLHAWAFVCGGTWSKRYIFFLYGYTVLESFWSTHDALSIITIE
jgi:hypothetical protein